ncbi:MAG: OB-fold nucleic acid binding domain-containing protein, partial [Rhodanobacteraceae bacterium]
MSEANDQVATPAVDENKLIAERREKLRALRGQGIAFPNDYRPDALAGDLQRETEGQDAAVLADGARRVRIAGRLLGKRVMGKASFARLQDTTGSIQLFLQKDALGDSYDAFKGWDV